MQWETIVASLVSSILGSGIVIWIVKKWIEYKYEIKLESFKISSKEKAEKESRRKEVDKKLYIEIMEDGVTAGTMEYFRTQSVGQPLSSSRIMDLSGIDIVYSRVDNEFLNQEIEKCKIEFLQSIRLFHYKTLPILFTVGGSMDHLGVPKEWASEQREEWEKAIDLLREVQEKLVQSYTDFVRVARDELDV